MKAVALRHVHFEDLGSFAAPIAAAGYDVEYRNAGDPDFTAFAAVDPDLLVVLGGPIGVYETEAYPFLTHEIALIAERLKAGRHRSLHRSAIRTLACRPCCRTGERRNRFESVAG